MLQQIREPINGLTHLAGAILAFVGLIMMMAKSAVDSSSPLTMGAVAIFGISMILLYSASATYHMVIAQEAVISFLRRLDHSMIFVLIAGTYAPFCLVSLNGFTGWALFSVVMAAAISGVVFKMVWFDCPRWISTALYISMGWMIIFAAGPLAGSLPAPGLWLLVTGGIFYTVGGLIYGFKFEFLKTKYMGFHEIFHIFILLGSLAHFLSVYLFVI